MAKRSKAAKTATKLEQWEIESAHASAEDLAHYCDHVDCTRPSIDIARESVGGDDEVYLWAVARKLDELRGV